MNEAVFLDRDGVINPNIFNKATGDWESPYILGDFKLFPGVIKALKKLQKGGFYLFMVSNQPSYAKGKAVLENIKAIQKELDSIMLKNKIRFTEYFYCYHHPQGIIPELSINCECRKPGTLFLEEARKRYSLDMGSCWMIGDRDSDIACGRKAGVRTILVLNKDEINAKRSGAVLPDFEALDLSGAVDIIFKKREEYNVK